MKIIHGEIQVADRWENWELALEGKSRYLGTSIERLEIGPSRVFK
jgi:hypothetical protein